ncbi:MAG: DUF1007 family protein [Alphaproteobacteria bacterium]
MVRCGFVVLACCLCLLILGGGAEKATAHPHVWVDYWVKVIADDKGITKLRFTWRFDKMFSQLVRDDKKINTIGAKEIKILREQVFANLENYHYYIYAKYDGVPYEPNKIEDFTARLHDGKQLEYEFTVPLPRAAQAVEVSLLDEEFYVDIGPPQGPPVAAVASVMAKATPQYKQFVSSSGEKGANAPLCEAIQGEPRVNKMWGKFQNFVVKCKTGT